LLVYVYLRQAPTGSTSTASLDRASQYPRYQAAEHPWDPAIQAAQWATTDTELGVKTSQGIYECENYWLGTNHYQIELMANLDGVPEVGALCIYTFPKPLNGPGFPARVFAVFP